MRPTSWILASLVLVVGAAATSQEKKPPKGDESRLAADVAAQEKELAGIERQIVAKEKELADLRARGDGLRAVIGQAKPPAIVGAWEVTSYHTTQAGLFQMLWGARRREANVRFEQTGDRLTGHVVSTERGGVKGEPIVFRTLRFSGDRLVFEYDLKWEPGVGPLAVESGRLQNQGMLRAAARLTGDRLIGTWGLFTTEGAEVFRGEWEAVRAGNAEEMSRGEPNQALHLAPTPARAQDAEAEKLYRAMEKKILTAKSFALEFNSQVAVDGQKFSVKGTIHIAPGGKTRLDLESELFQLGGKTLIVTNGESRYAKVGDIVFDKGPFPPKGEVLLALIARFAAAGAALEQKIAATDLEPDWPLKNFKLGAKEMVGKQEAQVVQYQFEDKKTGDLTDVTVWIDTKTQLPLKRTLSGKDKKTIGDLTETYSMLTVDGKLDDKLFEIPVKK